MDKYWIKEALRYIRAHNSIKSVTRINELPDQQSVEIVVILNVNLPGNYIEKGITNLGVKAEEEVVFLFSIDFPYKAPSIKLRKDFPRVFPHINPCKEDVIPCIYDGDLAELLQQPKWFDEILDQLVEWLEDAASNSLLNPEQGWEPMRIDNPNGYISYDQHSFLEHLKTSDYGYKPVIYKEIENTLFVEIDQGIGKKSDAMLCVFRSKHLISEYSASRISTLSEFVEYANTLGISDISEKIERQDMLNRSHDLLFITLVIERPYKIIGSDYKFEMLNFVISKSPPRKKKRRLLSNCNVNMLLHLTPTNSRVLKKLSGYNTKLDSKKNVAILGAGSLGSKIALHLARNGNGPFLCIDNETFSPHNHARHGLSSACFANKAWLLAQALQSIINIKCNYDREGVSADFSNSKFIIDSTASLAIRSFLICQENLPPIISMGLYNQGKFGLMLQEGKDCKLSDLWAYLYIQSIQNTTLKKMLFQSETDSVLIGQSCRSITSIVGDSEISSHSSCFSYHIQRCLEGQLSEGGQVLITKWENGFINGESLNEVEGEEVSSDFDGWQVRILTRVEKQIEEISLKAGINEAGGVITGTVFLSSRVIVISGIIPAPSDSIFTPNKFILGKEELSGVVEKLERDTQGKVTYLGTWHSHPMGGNASRIDRETFNKLLLNRECEPTICIIWSQEGLKLVPLEK